MLGPPHDGAHDDSWSIILKTSHRCTYRLEQRDWPKDGARGNSSSAGSLPAAPSGEGATRCPVLQPGACDDRWCLAATVQAAMPGGTRSSFWEMSQEA